MSDYLREREREKKLEKIRGPVRRKGGNGIKARVFAYMRAENRRVKGVQQHPQLIANHLFPAATHTVRHNEAVNRAIGQLTAEGKLQKIREGSYIIAGSWTGPIPQKEPAPKKRKRRPIGGWNRAMLAVLMGAHESDDTGGAHFGTTKDKRTVRQLVKRKLARVVREVPRTARHGAEIYALPTAAGVEAYKEARTR